MRGISARQVCEFKKANIGTETANQIFFNPTLGRVDINLLVCDTVFDGQERYDAAFFDFDKNLSSGFIARMHQGDWAPFALPSTVPDDAGVHRLRQRCRRIMGKAAGL